MTRALLRSIPLALCLLTGSALAAPGGDPLPPEAPPVTAPAKAADPKPAKPDTTKSKAKHRPKKAKTKHARTKHTKKSHKKAKAKAKEDGGAKAAQPAPTTKPAAK